MLPLLAGWLPTALTTNSHCCTHTQTGFLPFNGSGDLGRAAGCLQPLWAGLALSPACWHGSPSSLLAGCPLLQGNKKAQVEQHHEGELLAGVPPALLLVFQGSWAEGWGP